MSKPSIRKYGIVRNGQRVYYPGSVNVHIEQMKSLEGKEFEEEIKEKSNKPSLGTHGFYRGALIATCLTTEKFGGWIKEDIDDFFCNMFLKHVVEKIFPDNTRTEIIVIHSTGDLNQHEMNEFVAKVEQWMINEGIQILTKDEYNLSKYRIIKK